VVQFNIVVIFAHEVRELFQNNGCNLYQNFEHSWLRAWKSCRVWAMLSSMDFHTKALIKIVINLINCKKDRLHWCNR